MQRHLLSAAISATLVLLAACSQPAKQIAEEPPKTGGVRPLTDAPLRSVDAVGSTTATGQKKDADERRSERGRGSHDDSPRDKEVGLAAAAPVAGEKAKTEADRSLAYGAPGGDRKQVVNEVAALAPPSSTPMGNTGMPTLQPPSPPADGRYWEPANRENYADHKDNAVMLTAENPVSTFSIDVDTGSYSNVRRQLNQGVLPPADSVRAEEFINYFDYGYTPPTSVETPFSVTTEIAAAPWNHDHQLLLVGIKGYEVPKAEIPAANLVFLIDTSGSMQSPDKIELLKAAFKQMVPQLRHQDHVSIVVYAGSAGLVLPPTAGDDHDTIIAALDRLSAGGSTNGAAGIELAYRMAEKTLVPNGVNRVILATDGDFNVGTVSVDALKTMVAERRKSGIALTTLGFGEGNYNDEMAEQLADVGNGNHFYIDTLNEGRKVLIDELAATMLTIAKDVKIQIEFNPKVVAEYRLIGYENRMLRREDFNNDRIDAGEIGAGHNVTALYELTLVGSKGRQVEPLRYGDTTAARGPDGKEMGFLRLRYKQPDQDTSRLIERPLLTSDIRSQPTQRLAFAAAVAGYADLLRGGTHLGQWGYNDLLRLASDNAGDDRYGYRREMATLIAKAQRIAHPDAPQVQVSSN